MSEVPKYFFQHTRLVVVRGLGNVGPTRGHRAGRGPIRTVMGPRYGCLVITVQEATRPVASLAM
jgi:hypothetical protein